MLKSMISRSMGASMLMAGMLALATTALAQTTPATKVLNFVNMESVYENSAPTV